MEFFSFISTEGGFLSFHFNALSTFDKSFREG